ncbi:MAG TPA: porin [Kiritimatiellia bacterium]|nr:porin [Kiritimatiellia bacterium]
MKTQRTKWTLALVGLAWLAANNGVRAETATDEKLQALDQKVRVLERKLELAEESTAAKAKEAAILTAGPGGFSLSSGDKAFALRLRGFTQADSRFFIDDDDDRLNDTFLIRRARIILDAQLGRYFAARIAPDFGGGQTQLQDAYVDFKGGDRFNLRVGRTKVPLGLERLQSSTERLFSETALVTALTPNRDEGVLAYGSLAKGVLEYQFGVFNGGADGASIDSDSNDDFDLAGRFWLSPFKQSDSAALNGLSIGIAGSVGKQSGTTNATGLASYRSSGQATFFSYRTSSSNSADTAVANGDRARIAPQFYYAGGPVSLLGEYIISEQEVSNGKGAAKLQHEAWQLAASWVLTGETPTLRGVNPAKPFDASKGQWGAFELKARIGELNIDDEAFSGGYAQSSRSAKSAEAVGFGLNWYLTRNARFSLDYEQTSFDGGGANNADRPEEKVVIARAQLAF